MGKALGVGQHIYSRLPSWDLPDFLNSWKSYSLNRSNPIFAQKESISEGWALDLAVRPCGRGLQRKVRPWCSYLLLTACPTLETHTCLSKIQGGSPFQIAHYVRYGEPRLQKNSLLTY